MRHFGKLLAALLIAAFDGTPGGTQCTLLYAMSRGLQIVDLPVVTQEFTRI